MTVWAGRVTSVHAAYFRESMLQWKTTKLSSISSMKMFGWQQVAAEKNAAGMGKLVRLINESFFMHGPLSLSLPVAVF